MTAFFRGRAGRAVEEYLAVLHKAIGSASENNCGVRVTCYRNGDIVITATDGLKLGNIVVEENQ